MKKIIEFPNKELIQEKAAEWLVKLDDGRLSEPEKVELKRWLEESSEHADIFRDTYATWEGMVSLKGLAEVFPLERLEVNGSARVSVANEQSRFGKIAAFTGVAASFAAFFMVYSLWFAGVYKTGVGQTDVVKLADGSRVTLNTNTKVKISLNKNIRRIDLLKGEAYFQVAKDVQRPFLVFSGENVVSAVGTAFSVYKGKYALEVIVSEGVVQLQSTTDRNSEWASETENKMGAHTPETAPVLVESGQVAIYKNSTLAVQSVGSEAIEKELLWQENILVFDGEPLHEVISEFQRYTSKKILVGDNIRDIRVGGYFKSDDIEGMFKALEFNFGVRVARIDDDSVRLEK